MKIRGQNQYNSICLLRRPEIVPPMKAPVATPGRPRRPPKSANTLVCGKGLHSTRSHCGSSAPTLDQGLLMPASATGSAARPKPKRVFVTLLFTLAVTYGVTLAVTRDSPDSAAVGTCAPMAGRGNRDRRRTGTECGGRRRERLRCDVRGACGLPGAHGKVRSAHTKV